VLAPRDYQLRAIEACRAQYAKGRRAVCLVLPTGAGKTVVASVVVGSHVERPNTSVLFAVHRNELEDQAESKFRDVGLTVGPMFRVQIESIQTLVKRGTLPKASLVVFDECHHLADHNTWGDLPKRYLEQGAQILGLTATPSRGDGRPLAGFDSLVVGTTLSELTARGYLVPCTVIAPPRGSELADPVAALQEYAPGRPAIVFASNVAHAEQIAASLRSLGVRAESVDGKLHPTERKRRLDDFKAGRLLVLTSVHVLTEGFDATRAEVCVVARGCSAACTWLQMVGRVLRPHPGKKSALVIDCKGCVYEHGLPSDDREWSLNGKQGRALEKLVSLRQCPQCGAVFRRAPVCLHCKYTFPLEPPPQARVIPMTEVASVDGFGERARTMYLGFVAIAKTRGYKPGWAAMLFKSKMGRFPPREWGEA
jgi:DNA repair protein RadD